MSNILIINFFYGDKRVPTARMISDIVELIDSKTNHSHILSSDQDYKNLKVNKIDEYYLKIILKKLMTIIKKFFFYFRIIAHFYKNNNYSKCIMLTDPPMINLIAPILKIKNPNLKIYLWTMDLYPEAFYVSRIFPLNSNLIFSFLKFLNNYSFKFIDKFILLGNCQMNEMKKYSNFNINNSKIIPPWDLRKITNFDNNKMSTFLLRNNLLGKKIILYAGNIGKAHSIETIIKLIKYLNNLNNDYFFLFSCVGSKKKLLIDNLHLCANCMVTSYFKEEETSYLLNSAYCHLITLEDSWKNIVYPSKLFGIIKTKKPVIYIGPKENDISEFIEKNGFGFSFKNDEKIENIVNTIFSLKDLNSDLDFFIDNKNPYHVKEFLEI